MFGNNSDMIPRTYSLKSYKRRSSFGIKKALIYFIYFVVIVLIIGITFLAAFQLI